jgi:hypothetical protein
MGKCRVIAKLHLAPLLVAPGLRIIQFLFFKGMGKTLQ